MEYIERYTWNSKQERSEGNSHDDGEGGSRTTALQRARGTASAG